MENSILLAQDNKLTLSRQNFTPIEKRCLYYVIKEVRRIYVNRDLQENETSYQNIFSDMFLMLKAEQLQQLGDEVKDVYNALRKLRYKEIIIENEDIWVTTSWLLKAKHEKNKNIYEVQVSSELLPYLVELASQFTEYSLTVAISLKSTYSQRFYEICCMYRNKGKFFLEIEKLRYMLKIENKKAYDNTAELKRRVLDIAQKELQYLFESGQCDLYFTYRRKDMDKKRILSFWFDIHTRETEEQKRLQYAETEIQIKRILEICGLFIKRDSKYLERLKSFLYINLDIVRDVLDKLEKKVNDYSKKEIPAIIRYVLREDFGFK